MLNKSWMKVAMFPTEEVGTIGDAKSVDYDLRAVVIDFERGTVNMPMESSVSIKSLSKVLITLRDERTTYDRKHIEDMDGEDLYAYRLAQGILTYEPFMHICIRDAARLLCDHDYHKAYYKKQYENGATIWTVDENDEIMVVNGEMFYEFPVRR